MIIITPRRGKGKRKKKLKDERPTSNVQHRMVNGKDKETDVDSVVKSQVMRSFVIPDPHQVRDKLQPGTE
ncbi:MAG: hypothetical protein U9R02_00315 [Thermodesulfobacteriota bacterium]|nr:hypothetical protein [Thermodesulfobacteriota bacterium]